MPIKKAAFKHQRQTKIRTVKNAAIKKGLKQFIKDARRAISQKNVELVKEFSAKFQKVIDKAAQARVIKKPNAARRKSRLQRQIQAVLKG